MAEVITRDMLQLLARDLSHPGSMVHVLGLY